MLLSDHEIIKRCEDERMIFPFERNSVRTVQEKQLGGSTYDRKIFSYGTSSYGYDVRLSKEIKIFTNLNSGVLDPKEMDERCLHEAEVHTDPAKGKYVILPPNSFLLGRTVEYFRIPRDILVVCLGKSSLARVGQNVIVTPLEPEWEGEVVIEIANLTNLPSRVYIDEGVAQFLFHLGNTVCETSYADRSGKYQGQRGITLPKL